MKIFNILIAAIIAVFAQGQIIDKAFNELTLKKSITGGAYLGIEIDGNFEGYIIIGLYGDWAPKSVENFSALCDGSKGVGESGKPLHYQGTKIHNILPGGMI